MDDKEKKKKLLDTFSWRWHEIQTYLHIPISVLIKKPQVSLFLWHVIILSQVLVKIFI